MPSATEVYPKTVPESRYFRTQTPIPAINVRLVRNQICPQNELFKLVLFLSDSFDRLQKKTRNVNLKCIFM